ncbi:MAG: hypothetical protein ACREQ8_15670 [Woeseiaceae bacterium]
MSDPSAARKYVLRTALFMGGYAALNLAAIAGAFDDLKPPATWAFALAAAAPVIGHIWSLLAYLRDADEFVRALMARRLIVATGLSTALVSAWGLLEVYAGATHFPAILFYPLLWAAFGVATPFIRSTR